MQRPQVRPEPMRHGGDVEFSQWDGVPLCTGSKVLIDLTPPRRPRLPDDVNANRSIFRFDEVREVVVFVNDVSPILPQSANQICS